MTIDQFINVLVTIMLIEMMVTVGLSTRMGELIDLAKNGRLIVQAGLANYVCVPLLTVGLLILFHPADPMVSAGFLILAVCPGAPFGPPCVKIAKGNVPVAVGLMVILAGSSAIMAPLLLRLLLPRLSGDGIIEVNAVQIVGTLLVTQLLPLCIGLCVRCWLPALADRLQKPASLVSAVLGLSAIGLILAVQFDLLAEIDLRGWAGMAMLLIASIASGWLLGGPGTGSRKALALTTSLRNVGVGLVIATANFARTAAVTATVVYGIFEILGSFVLALWWTRASAMALRRQPGVLG
jgi:BASS family bile acid:Na+ symporter